MSKTGGIHLCTGITAGGLDLHMQVVLELGMHI